MGLAPTSNPFAMLRHASPLGLVIRHGHPVIPGTHGRRPASTGSAPKSPRIRSDCLRSCRLPSSITTRCSRAVHQQTGNFRSREYMEYVWRCLERCVFKDDNVKGLIYVLKRLFYEVCGIFYALYVKSQFLGSGQFWWCFFSGMYLQVGDSGPGSFVRAGWPCYSCLSTNLPHWVWNRGQPSLNCREEQGCRHGVITPAPENHSWPGQSSQPPIPLNLSGIKVLEVYAFQVIVPDCVCLATILGVCPYFSQPIQWPIQIFATDIPLRTTPYFPWQRPHIGSE